MSGRLQREIKQSHPFASVEEEAYLNLRRTADALMRAEASLLKRIDLSGAQYNVLRILRGAGKPGLACGEIAERMVSRDPDITRLLDRLEARDLIVRTRDASDRRVVTSKITAKGLTLIKGVEQPLTRLHRGQLSHLGEEKLTALIDLLELARAQLNSVTRIRKERT
ncbi:MAG: MarR family transcriptional regulator [Planctomycetes bacterium]|nr:MarR family transcriptional regulator [Planctomycetota bacterium]